MTENRKAESSAARTALGASPCPICGDPMGEDPQVAYSNTDGRRVATCEPCRAIFSNMMLEVTLHRRKAFVHRSSNPAKIDKSIRDAVVAERVRLSAKAR